MTPLDSDRYLDADTSTNKTGLAISQSLDAYSEHIHAARAAQKGYCLTCLFDYVVNLWLPRHLCARVWFGTN